MLLVVLHHAIPFGVRHAKAEDGGPGLSCRDAAELLPEAAAVVDVVPEDERGWAGAQELASNQQRLREPLGTRLFRVRERQPPALSITQQIAEAWQVRAARDDQHLPDTGEHQCGQWIVDHWLVV